MSTSLILMAYYPDYVLIMQGKLGTLKFLTFTLSICGQFPKPFLHWSLVYWRQVAIRSSCLLFTLLICYGPAKCCSSQCSANFTSSAIKINWWMFCLMHLLISINTVLVNRQPLHQALQAQKNLLVWTSIIHLETICYGT